MARSKVFNAFFWDYLNIVAKQGTSFVLGIILARLLVPEDFGLIGMMAVFNSFAAALIQMGFYSALIREKDCTEEMYSSVFWLNLATGCTITLIFFFCAPLFAGFFNQPKLANVVRITSFNFIANSLNLVQIVRLSKSLNFKKQSQAQIISMAISGCISIIMAYAGFGVWSIVWQTVISSYLNTIILWINGKWWPALYFNIIYIKQVWKFSFYMFISGIINSVAEKMDTVLIGKFLTPATLGNYTRAQSLNTLLVRFTSESIGKISFPLIAAAKTKEEMIEMNKKVLNIVCFVLFPLITLIYLNAEFIIITLFTEKWMESVAYLKLTILTGFAYPVNAQILSVIKSSGRSELFLRAEILKVASYFTIVISAFYMGGMYGLLVGLIISACISTAINIYFANAALHTQSYYQAQIILKHLGLILLLTLPCVLLVEYTFVHSVVAGILFIFLYLLSARFLKLPGYLFIQSKLPFKI